MDLPSKNMYHFMWDDGELENDGDPQLSPKERVAKILKETELEDLPDLVFRTKEDTSKIKRKKQNNNDLPFSLKSDTELFSIGNHSDEDDFEASFILNNKTNKNTKTSNNNNHDNSKAQLPVSQTYQDRKPASVPPVINIHHPRIDPNSTSDKRSSDTYIVDALKSTVVYGSSTEPDTKNESNTSSLLPTQGGKFLKDMEFDDDLDSGVAVEDEENNDRNQDTVPIVTVDQSQLTEKWRKRKQRINVIVAISLLVLGVIILVIAVVLIVRMLKAG